MKIHAHRGLAHRGMAMTLDQISQELGITKERVRQIEAKAITKIRAQLEARGMKPEFILPPNYDEAKA